MLSICIPIYNCNCVKLLEDLLSQMEALKIDSELICIDDGSHQFKELNETYVSNKSINYTALKKNIGRSKIRNLFVSKACFEYMLFLDCDVKITSHFLENYIIHFKKDVVYGGTSYSAKIPEDKNQFLHYKYGHQKESIKLEKRERHPYQTFKTNNFLTPKSYLQKYPFDIRLNQYGHEDSLWAFTLKENAVQIIHIDNPIIHQGLEVNTVLLRKIEQSLENLHYLNKDNLSLPLRVNTIYNNYRPFWKFFSSNFTRRLLKNNILGRHPSLSLLDVYKLLYLASLKA